MGMWLWTDQTFLGGILNFETQGAGRRWRGRWPSKINSNLGKHWCCCWFGQKWPSNRIKNDSRILEHPKTVVLRILKEDLGKRKLFARIVLHSLILEQREVRVTSFQDIIALADADKKCSQKYCGWWDLVFCLWPRNKATEFWMVWWAEGTEIPKVPHVDTPSKRIF